MDPDSSDALQRKRTDLRAVYDIAISELRALNDSKVAGLIERLERHRRLIESRPHLSAHAR
jgi:hypothetical protein